MPNSAYSRRPPADTVPLKPTEWIGTALRDLRALPDEPRRSFGYAIHLAQLGRHHLTAKRLKGEFAGLIEVVDDFDGETYRAIYTAKLADVVYVLHVFQKKSTRGIATQKHEVAVIRERWRRAKAHYAAHHQNREE
jgi:phage-related protein